MGLWAQIYVDPNNNVGIGTTTPTSQFESYQDDNVNGVNGTFRTYSLSSGTIVGIDNFVNSSGLGGRYGIRNTVNAASNNSNNVFGLYNDITGSAALTYGVYNEMVQPSSANTMVAVRNNISSPGSNAVYGEYTSINSTSNATGVRYGNYITMSGSGVGIRYGVYSNVTGAANYAGFFNGNVMVTGLFLNPSDSRIKENVRPIASALGTLQQLQPRSYEYRQDLGLSLPDGPQYGFIAQDLAKVLPNLVHDSQAPVALQVHNADAKGKGLETDMPTDPTSLQVQTINYIGLIPILTQAIQELEAKVDAQAQTITALQAEINRR